MELLPRGSPSLRAMSCASCGCDVPAYTGPVGRRDELARCGVGEREHEQDERGAWQDGGLPEKILRLSADPIVSS
jgi:hypothetical protein